MAYYRSRPSRSKTKLEIPLFKSFERLDLKDLLRIKTGYERYCQRKRQFEIDEKIRESTNSITRQRFEHETYIFETKLKHFQATVISPLEHRRHALVEKLRQHKVGFFDSLLTDVQRWNGMNIERSVALSILPLLEAIDLEKNRVLRDAPKGPERPAYQKGKSFTHDVTMVFSGVRLRINFESLDIKKIDNLVGIKTEAIGEQKAKVERLKARAAVTEKEKRKQASKIRYGSAYKKQKQLLKECPYCGGILNESEAHQDHIYPVAKGGQSTRENLVFVCSNCNFRKRSMTLRQFLEKNGLCEKTVHLRLQILRKDF